MNYTPKQEAVMRGCGCLLVLAVLAAIHALLIGCAAGPTISTSSGLGYARPSVGAVVQAEGPAGRVEARALSVSKLNGGEGWAVSGHALVDLVRHSEWSLLVGVDGNHQDVERYESERIAPRIEAGYRGLSLYWIGEDRKIESVVGLRASLRRRILLDVARVQHSEGSGTRVELSYLWRLK